MRACTGVLIRTALTAALGLLLLACTQTRWENPAASPELAAADQSECQRTADLAAREQVMFERVAGPRPVRGGVIGYPTRDGGFRERNSEWFWTQHYFDACMRNKGYRLVRVE
ncbi:MAG TPA: hypothetical protein VHM01_04765 [Alphaproteobacteria bacterium]|nr:hypothetical protein [Alphaproteobacteria bacterium]